MSEDIRPSRWEQFKIFLFRSLFCALGGMTCGAWLKLLRKNRFAVEIRFWPRAALITQCSIVNSINHRCEDLLYGAEITAQKIDSPLFILGHYRTGTTHLHNLLAVDRRFAFPNAYQVCFPHTFLLTETWGKRSGFLLPSRRLQDNVHLSMNVPQEDEMALCVMTSLSPYMGWVFPRGRENYDRYLTFRGVPETEIARWKAAFVHFLQKLTLKYRRPLLLKSPPHTCRIKLLLEMFPDARFVHIHRDPFTVFQSTRRLIEKAIPAMRLQVWDNRDLDAWILRTLQVMYEVYFEERGAIPRGQLHEIGFEALEQDPIGQLRKLYQTLSVPDFDTVEPDLQRYAVSLAGYQKNMYSPLSHEQRDRISQMWRQYFDEWGYAILS